MRAMATQLSPSCCAGWAGSGERLRPNCELEYKSAKLVPKLVWL